MIRDIAIIVMAVMVTAAARSTGAKIFFADEAHFQADADLRGKWVLKEEPALVDSTSPRRGEKASYYSAVCLETGEVEVMELTGNSNAATATTFLRQLRARHIGPLTVIWGNSTAHRGASPVVHADETGGWEDGHNGYVWTFSTPTERYFCVGAGARGRWMKPWAIPSPACWSAFLRRLPSLLRPQTTLLGPPAAGHPRPANLIPLQKWLTLVTKHRQSIPENTDHAAPPPQQFKTAPPGNPTQEHRTGPRSSHRACLATRHCLNRIGSAFTPPQPVLRCKRRSQLPRYRSPVRPHVLHSLPHGYGEGDMHAIADGTYPSTRDALGTTKQASGQHHGSSLVHRQPVSLHELHPANDGTVRRVDLYDFNSFPVTTGDEIRLDLAVR